jgi:hypothetical protein
VQCTVERAAHHVNPMCALHSRSGLFGGDQAHLHMDAADNQNAFVCSDFACYFGGQLSITGIDLARFQRTSKGSHHSTGGCGNDVINRRGVRLSQFPRINFVMFGDCPMNAVYDRLRLAGQVGNSEGPLSPFNSGLRNVNNVTHRFLLPSMGELI